MATHCSILAWEIPWTKEPGGLESKGLQRVEHKRATKQKQPKSLKKKKSLKCQKKRGGRKEGARGEWREEGKKEGKRKNKRKERKGKVKELLLITKKYENLKLEKPFPPLSLVL